MKLTQEFAQAPVVGCKRVAKTDNAGSHAKVYFTKHIDTEHLIKLYNLINESIYGKVAIKLHTGEKHGPNILPRELVKALQQQIPNSTIVETNTLYQGDRYTTEEHLETLKVNGWTFCPVDIMDAEGTINLPVRHGHLNFGILYTAQIQFLNHCHGCCTVFHLSVQHGNGNSPSFPGGCITADLKERCNTSKPLKCLIICQKDFTAPDGAVHAITGSVKGNSDNRFLTVILGHAG